MSVLPHATGGVAMNVPMIAVVGANTADATKKKSFAIQVGTLSSALEHAVPEQMFATDLLNPPDAISAVKALSKARAAGQRIRKQSQTIVSGLRKQSCQACTLDDFVSRY